MRHLTSLIRVVESTHRFIEPPVRNAPIALETTAASTTARIVPEKCPRHRRA
jgi:hypothetical protein